MHPSLPAPAYADTALHCESCGRSPAVMDGDVPLCLECGDRMRAEASEEALADADPMMARLAAGVRERGNVFRVKVPGNERTAMMMNRGEEGSA